MTTNKQNIELTSEEQEALSQELPLLLNAVVQGTNPVARAWLASWRSKREMTEDAKEQAESIKEKVTDAVENAPQEQVSIAQWCGFPTDMTRCSPFFPMNRNETHERKYLQNYIITSANWGTIKYSGPQLSTYDEDVLLTILAILDSNTVYKTKEFKVYEEANYDPIPVGPGDRQEILDKSRQTISYYGPIKPLLKVFGYKNASKKDYTRFMNSLERLESAIMKMELSAGKTKSGKPKKPTTVQIINILSCVFYDEKDSKIIVSVNPYFYETYIAGRITLLDVSKRLSIKGVIAKALYRFIQSQRSGNFTGHFLTLADALNMDREQPGWKNRQLLKKAINELIRHGILIKKSGFMDQDIISLTRTTETMPKVQKKKLEKC